MPETKRVSYLTWMFHALGFEYAILLTLAGLICFVLALIVVIRGRGPMAVAALILIVHVPLLIGAFAAIQGAIASYSVVAMSTTAPNPSEVAAGTSTALFASMVGMLLTIPGYATAACGAFFRSLQSKVESTKSRP